MSIEVRGITKQYGTYRALDNVDLDVNTGELVALLGPSGSGKTTLLRVIAGLHEADRGQVLFHGEDTLSKSVRERRVGFVFQHYALFKHMSVFENVAFGLRVLPRHKRPPRNEIRDRVMDLLRMVQVDWLANQKPSQLSGGQRQRVALARALVIEPRVLLLDEPFGALDAKVRRELRQWLRRLHDELHITSVFVTHDQEEALELADRVAILDQGRIVQHGTPEEIYEHPASPFVYEFLGNVNLFHSRLEGNGRALIHGAHVSDPSLPEAASGEGRAYVRPHDLEIHLAAMNGSSFEAVVRHFTRLGPLVRIELNRPDSEESILVDTTHERIGELRLVKGAHVFLRPRRVRMFHDSLTSSSL